jgi:hypothetical protein
MKRLIALSIAIFTTVSFACTDFTGEYYDEEDGTYFSLTQNGCESIQYNYDEGPVLRMIDGKDYLVNQYDIVVEEGKVLANVKIFSSNKFKNDKLITDARSEVTYSSSGELEIEKAWAETFLNKQTDMISISHGKDGSKETTINKRVK